MDVRFVNPVLDSIINVLSTMANMTPEPGAPSIKEDTHALGVVTGVIDFKGPKEHVSTAISFSKHVALEITERMLRTRPNDIDEIVEDLVGEISNMMAGGAKGKLEAEGYDFELTLPSVATGEGHEVPHRIEGKTILLPFKTDAGEFFVEIRSN